MQEIFILSSHILHTKGNTMNKIFLTLLITFGFTSALFASIQNDVKHSKPMSEHKIKKMDRKLNKHKAVKRNFKTQKEFNHKLQRKSITKHKKHLSKQNMRYNNGYNYNRNMPKAYYRTIRQRGYNYSNRGWSLAYKYDRASFYDNQGYFYGYFNRYGYYFEDIFYRYDRYYTYRDRVRGRGLFSHRYYMPANANYYGFCATRHTDRNYERGYDRY